MNHELITDRMINSIFGKILHFIAAVLLAIMIQCQSKNTDQRELSLPAGDYAQMIVTDNTTIILCWDKPSIPDEQISGYDLWYKPEQEKEWKILKQFIPATDSPWTSVSRTDLDTNYSTFNLGVRTLLSNGQTSSMHTADDSTAAAHKRWILKWESD